MFVVDTNVLLYAAESSFPDHEDCRRRLERWRATEAAWFVTWSIIYEFLRVSTHPRVFAKPWSIHAAFDFVEAVLAAPGLELLGETDRHAAVAREVLRDVPGLRGRVVHDTHTAVLMREHGVSRICTRDTDFRRFPFLEVIDPLAT